MSHGDPLVVGVGIDNQRRTLGKNVRQEDRILRAAEIVGAHEQWMASLANRQGFSVGHAQVARHTADAQPRRSFMIVEGNHAERAPHILSFLPYMIGSAVLARQADMPAYRTDVSVIAEALATKLDIPPATVVRTILLDGAAARAVLDPTKDPRNIPVGVLSDGPPLEEIQRIEQGSRKHF